MRRLIDADAFERRCMFDENIEDMQDVIYALRDFPTIDAEPVRHGKWIVTNEGVVKCSECKRKFILLKENYCPHCGARMDEE